MKCTVLAVVVSVFASSAALADDPFQPEAGYKSLFNGTDLTGWRYDNKPMDGRTATPDMRFQIADGAIVANVGKGIKNLFTIAEFNGDFDLKLEFRAAAKADSGVYVRGPQLQVRDFIRMNQQQHLKSVFKNDDWNELHIAVRSNTIVTVKKALSKSDTLVLVVKDGKAAAKVNGQDLAAGDVALSSGVAAVCKLNGVAFDPNYKPGAKGGIGLQAETGKFEFRRIRIKEVR